MSAVEPFSSVTFCCREGDEPLEDRWLEGKVLEDRERVMLLIADRAAIALDPADVLDRGGERDDDTTLDRLRIRGAAHPIGLTAPTREALLAFVRDRPATSDDVSAVPLSGGGGGGGRPGGGGIPPVPPPVPPTPQCWSRIPHICMPPSTNRC